MARLALDHLVVTAERLDDGVAFVEDRLGVAMAPGGRHPAMGTHNRLLGLGEVYLEVIAVDPGAAPPGRARLFGLDGVSGPPRLSHWVARTGDLAAALALAPPGAGEIVELSRGDLRWTMSVPADGRLPHGDAFPAMIAWGAAPHPTARLPDAGCRLQSLRISHPDAAALRHALDRYEGGLAGHVVSGDAVVFDAVIATPGGSRRLA